MAARPRCGDHFRDTAAHRNREPEAPLEPVDVGPADRIHRHQIVVAGGGEGKVDLDRRCHLGRLGHQRALFLDAPAVAQLEGRDALRAADLLAEVHDARARGQLRDTRVT